MNKTKLPWSERVGAISTNPHMATIDDIAQLAADLMDSNQRLEKAIKILKDLYACKYESDKTLVLVEHQVRDILLSNQTRPKQ